MKKIILELGFRSLYMVFFYIGITFCFYLSFGLQYEYASILCQSHYQSIDFCFESSLWQWYKADRSAHGGWLCNGNGDDLKKAGLFWCEDFNLHHQSKSWGLLSLTSVSYFHSLTVDPSFLVWLYKARLLFIFFSFQLSGFLLPGQLSSSRQESVAIAHIAAIVMILSTLTALPLLAILAEFSIEPFDSELIHLRV